MMGLKDVQKKYNLPKLKRGMMVRYADMYGEITGTPRGSSSYINVRDEDGYRYTFHPFDLNYRVDDDAWVRGEHLKQKYDAAWDKWNENANKYFNQQKLEAVIKCINETGYRGRTSLKTDTGATDQQLDQWIAEGHLCVLSDGTCIDTPERLRQRLEVVHSWSRA